MSYLKPQKGLFALLFILIFTVLAAPEEARAQGSLQQSPIELPRNPELEREAKHNLEVARFYMKKKAYKAVTDRLLEVSYVYPQFSKFDEVLFLLGEAFLKQDNKADAARHFKQLVTDYPESPFIKEAKKLLPDLPAVAEKKE